MSDSLQETNVEEIARELTTRRNQGQHTTLFLGSRTGGLFSNEYLYDTLKQFSLLNFDTLSNIDKFRECYYVLSKRFKEQERYNLLVGALATLRYREEDKLLARLLTTGLFEAIISTNIDTLLENACDSWNLKEPDDYIVITSVENGVPRSKQNKPRYSSIIKAFGDLESRSYPIPGESFDLRKNGSYEFLQSKLSSDVLMVGYDPEWDQAIKGAIPLKGGTLWFVNESEMLQETDLASILKQRNGKLFQNNRGSYSNFIKILYDSLREQELTHKEPTRFRSLDVYRNKIAGESLPSFLQPLAKNGKRVFISYSHKDRKYLARLKIHLKGYLYQLKDTVDFWDDTNILPGTDWKEEMKKAVTQAEVAILLISTNYLSSQSVNTYELPLVLEAANKGNVKLLPIILDPSLPSFAGRELDQYQTVNSISNPLEEMKPSEREVIWKKLAEQVYAILRS